MPISSRTPEGSFGHCTVCGQPVVIEPSQTTRDATCPHCGSLLWFAAHDAELRARVERVKMELRKLVGEIDELSKKKINDSEFWTGFLTRTIPSLAAYGGFVWPPKGRKDRSVTAINAEILADPTWGIASTAHQTLLAELAQAGPQTVSPRHERSNVTRFWNPTPYLLVTATVPAGADDWLVEIVQRPDSSPGVRRGYLKFLTQMCELAESHFQKARP